jgi:hypothetical protein
MTTRHLIHIGYPKAGSTFLQEWFALHPQLLYQPGGLAGFHDIYNLCRQGADATKNPFAYHVTSSESLCMPHEATGTLSSAHHTGSTPAPIKARQARVCQMLRDLFFGSRILVVTRGFRSALQSGYSQLVRTGSVLSPHEMFCLEPQNSPSSVNDYYDYNYLLNLYTYAFGAENVIVLPYELLRDNQNAFIAALEKALELPHFEIDIGRANASLSPAELYWYPRISRVVMGIARRLGNKPFRKIYKLHIQQTYNNRWRRLIQILHRLQPDKVVTSADFANAPMQLFAGCADSLRHYPLYAPYAKEYLWE